MSKGKKIKVLFMIGSYGTGGKERQLAELIKCLPQEDFEIHLLVKETGANYLESFKYKLESFYSLDRKRFGLKSFFLIYKYIDNVKPDIVHSWEAATSIFSILIRFFSLHKFKTIDGSIRHAFSSFKYWSKYGVERLIISFFSDAIIANSNAGLKRFQTPKKISYCVHNGFDINRISELASTFQIRLRFNIKTRYLVGMVARFDKEKDWSTFLKAAVKILNYREDVSFLAVGSGRMLANFQETISTEYCGKIIFTGHQDNIESIVNSFDIGILTSNPLIQEGISNSILEYMAVGKPVIVTYGGGTSELVEDTINGFIIPAENPVELEKKINYLLDNKALRDKMSKANHQKILDSFSINTMSANYSRIYNKLIN